VNYPLLGRRIPDLDLLTADGPTRIFNLLNAARGILLKLCESWDFDPPPWAQRVSAIDVQQTTGWTLPVLGEIVPRTPC
jgi:3-(3-hydroxy-phenyl)propionate hydroxylase